MNVGDLIAKLQQVDPNTLVCGEDGEIGLEADINVYEVTACVDHSGHFAPYVDEHTKRDGKHENDERVIVITKWGHSDSPDVVEL
ncbi:hypothetical protein ACQ856_18300 [Mycolicibacterium psychrotolerans]|uniref:hypothetical protein n=1 Tax=Mycolicibacterium psychrotolerans TaxID=216929 RepID=UPI003D67D642